MPDPTLTDDRVLTGVRDVLVRTLGLEGDAGLDASTRLLGELPELDSLGIVELATALEQHFGIVVDDADFVGENFETVGALASFVRARLG